MSEIDDLPSWAPRTDQPAATTKAAPASPSGGSGRGRLLLYILLGVVLLVGAGAGGYVFVSGSGDGDETAAGDDAASDESTASTGSDDGATGSTEAEAAEDDGTQPYSGESAEASTATDGEVEADDTAAEGEPVDISDGSVRWTRIEDGTLYLEGTAPTQEMIDLIYNVTLSVAGDAPVENRLELDPSSPENAVGYPVHINDVVLFDFNSTTVRPEFYPLLDMGANLLLLDETYTITVVAHADSVGSEEINLRISQERAQAVKDYYVSQGAPPERVFTEAKGEAEAPDDDTRDEEFRRVEFFIGSSTLDE